MPKRSLDCRVATILAMTKGEVAGDAVGAGRDRWIAASLRSSQ